MEESQIAPIHARGLVKRYGDLVALAGLDLTVARGTCLGLLGPNGAGKTTTIEILEGLLDPEEGEVRVLGRTWRREGREIRERIGVQLQETQLTEKLTVAEHLRVFRSFYIQGREIDDVITLVGLTAKRDTRTHQLSGGQRQRLALGCALVSKPEILFLDEPTTGLDPQARRRVWEIVADFKANGGTVLLTTHYMDEAEILADQVVILDHGTIIADGTPRAIIASLGAESIVSFSVEPSAEAEVESEAFVESLVELPGVRSARRENGQTLLSVTHTERAVPALLDHLRQSGFALADLHTHRTTLEDVFVSLTGRQLRDD